MLTTARRLRAALDVSAAPQLAPADGAPHAADGQARSKGLTPPPGQLLDLQKLSALSAASARCVGVSAIIRRHVAAVPLCVRPSQVLSRALNRLAGPPSAAQRWQRPAEKSAPQHCPLRSQSSLSPPSRWLLPLPPQGTVGICGGTGSRPRSWRQATGAAIAVCRCGCTVLAGPRTHTNVGPAGEATM